MATADKILNFDKPQGGAWTGELIIKNFIIICRRGASEGKKLMATSKLLKREHALDTVSLTVAWILASLPVVAFVVFAIAAKGIH